MYKRQDVITDVVQLGEEEIELADIAPEHAHRDAHHGLDEGHEEGDGQTGACTGPDAGPQVLADASNAIIIGFNVRPDNVAKEEAAATKVEMRMYRVIYDAINDVTDAMKGMLAPKFREVALGELQVRQVYKISNVGTVAGCRVTSGKITRDSKVRVVRDGIVITEDEIASLKRFKDDAKEVAEGYECGVTLAKFADVKEGDVYEAFKMEEYRD